jgi:hypothetical protein
MGGDDGCVLYRSVHDGCAARPVCSWAIVWTSCSSYLPTSYIRVLKLQLDGSHLLRQADMATSMPWSSFASGLVLGSRMAHVTLEARAACVAWWAYMRHRYNGLPQILGASVGVLPTGKRKSHQSDSGMYLGCCHSAFDMFSLSWAISA